jgi:hypothetical protein
MKKFENILGVANLVVLLISGVLGYLFVQRPIAALEQQKLDVEARKSALDETKLNIDVSNLLKDLRPLLKFDCKHVAVAPLRVNVFCTANNVGEHKVFVDAPSVSLVFKKNREIVKAEAYKEQLEVKFTKANSIPPTLDGSFEYELVFTQAPDFHLFDLQTEFSAHTDSQVVQLIAKLLDGRVDRTLLDYISRQVYTLPSPVDTSALSAASSGQ